MARDLTAGCDVAVIGGGVVGCSVAYHLLGPMGFDGTVAVIEKDPTYAEGSTGRSVGGVRQQFSTPENIAMSLYGADFARAAAERLAVDGEAGPDPMFREEGYLFLATEETAPVLDANHALQTNHGADIARLDRDGLAERFPWLALDGLVGGGFGRTGEGWLDPYALLQGMRRKAKALGAHFVADRAVGIERADGRVAAVTTEATGRIPCGHAVNAAGAQAGRVAAMAGIDLPVGPRKRTVFVFDCREAPAGCPLTVDPTGVYFRPEGPHFLCGKSPDPADDPECDDFEIAYDPFEEVIWPVLAERVPAFEAIKLVNAWSGHYEVNALDANAVIGPHPDVANFLFANGFSGHGLQQAPAVGRAIAELIVHGGFRSLDLSRFGYERIAAGRPIKERNVV